MIQVNLVISENLCYKSSTLIYNGGLIKLYCNIYWKKKSFSSESQNVPSLDYFWVKKMGGILVLQYSTHCADETAWMHFKIYIGIRDMFNIGECTWYTQR